jgi:hypothetical protein
MQSINTNNSNINNSLIVRTTSTIKKTTSSLLAQTLIGSIKENIAEFAGYSALALLGGKITSYAGGIFLKGIGTLLGNGLAVGGGLTAGYLLLKDQNGQTNYLHIARNIALTAAASGLLLYTLPATLANAGEYIGAEGGEFVGALAGGIVGGFTAIRWLGSKEVLYNQQDPARTYAIKTIQCMAIFMLVDLYREPSEGGMIRPLTDLALGSLFYNVLDITDFIKNLKQGHGLDHCLPNETGMLVNDEIIHRFLAQQLASQSVDDIAKRVNLSTLLTDSVSEKLIQLIDEAPLQLIASHFLQKLKKMPLRSQAVENYASSQATKLLQPAIETIDSKTHLIHTQANHLLTCVIKGFNQYMDLISQTESIQQAQSHFGKLFIEWEKEKDPAVKKEKEKNLQLSKQELISSIKEGLRKKNDLSRLDYAELIKDNLHFIKDISSSDYEKIIQSVLEKLSEKKHDPSFSSSIIHPHTDSIANVLLSTLQSLEKKIVGLTFTSESEKNYMKELVEIHMDSIIELATLQLLFLNLDQNEQDTRDLYKNLSNLLFSHYCNEEISSSGLIKNLIKKQIASSDLYPVSP